MRVFGLRGAPAGGFPTSAVVRVVSGQYAGDTGTVVARDPDLRPGTVWVELRYAGTHLVPGYRLAVVTLPSSFSEGGSIEGGPPTLTEN